MSIENLLLLVKYRETRCVLCKRDPMNIDRCFGRGGYTFWMNCEFWMLWRTLPALSDVSSHRYIPPQVSLLLNGRWQCVRSHFSSLLTFTGLGEIELQYGVKVLSALSLISHTCLAHANASVANWPWSSKQFVLLQRVGEMGFRSLLIRQSCQMQPGSSLRTARSLELSFPRSFTRCYEYHILWLWKATHPTVTLWINSTTLALLFFSCLRNDMMGSGEAGWVPSKV